MVKKSIPEKQKQKKEIKYCRRCGRRLTNEDSRRLGFGAVCYRKHLKTKIKPLFNLRQKKEEYKMDIISKYDIELLLDKIKKQYSIGDEIVSALNVVINQAMMTEILYNENKELHIENDKLKTKILILQGRL